MGGTIKELENEKLDRSNKQFSQNHSAVWETEKYNSGELQMIESDFKKIITLFIFIRIITTLKDQA